MAALQNQFSLSGAQLYDHQTARFQDLHLTSSLPALLQQAHMFLSSTGLPSEGQMLYIFLYIDSHQGWWGRGMGNKRDKVSPLSLSLSRCSCCCSGWLKTTRYSWHFLFISFNLHSSIVHICKLFFTSIRVSVFMLCIVSLLSLHSILGGLCNNRPHAPVVELWLGLVLLWLSPGSLAADVAFIYVFVIFYIIRESDRLHLILWALCFAAQGHFDINWDWGKCRNNASSSWSTDLNWRANFSGT